MNKISENQEVNNSKKDSLFERYKILVAARNFHYNNFNKWLTYFYVANAGIFLGYLQVYPIASSPKIDLIPYLILMLGYFAGLLLYWSSKGYYYWNINFIMLINHYEKTLLGWEKNERIYSVFANTKVENKYHSPRHGGNYSTSKIAIVFAFIIAISWGAALTYSVICKLFDCDCLLVNISSLLISLLTSVAVTLLLSVPIKKKKHFLGSKTKYLDDLELNQN